MKYMKKTLLLLLCAAMLLPSCGNGGTTKETESVADTAAPETAETAAETTRLDVPDSLPEDLKCNGEKIVIQVRGDKNTIAEFFADEQTGESVNDATYVRNMNVMDRLNVVLEPSIGESVGGYGNTVAAIRASIQSADGAYDIISGWSAKIPQLSLEGLFLDVREIPYLDLEKEWWNQSCLTELRIANKLFFLAGDITQTMLYGMYVYMFNQTLAENYQIENPYTVVNDGRWTIDYVRQQTTDLYIDINGDGKVDTGDAFGLVTYQNNAVDSYMQGSLIRMIGRDDNDLPVLEAETERLATLVEKAYALHFENPGCMIVNDGEAGNMFNIFKEDRSLYTTAPLEYVCLLFGDMESDYGIIPYPKLDETQETYGTRVHDGLSLISVPIDCQKVEITGAVLEAMAAESWRRITPAIFDVALKYKYSRDPESAEMIELIKESAYIPFAAVYNESIGNPWFIMRNLMAKKSSDFASYWAKQQDVVEKGLDKAIQQIEEIPG